MPRLTALEQLHPDNSHSRDKIRQMPPCGANGDFVSKQNTPCPVCGTPAHAVLQYGETVSPTKAVAPQYVGTALQYVKIILQYGKKVLLVCKMPPPVCGTQL
jgi:hypothetical protein